MATVSLRGWASRLQGARRRAALQALLVTFLWSTSWVIIKIGLKGIPALTFAGLRYSLAFGCLVPLLLRREHRAGLARLPARRWGELAVLGLLYYAVTQGAQFVGLALLPAVTVSLLLNFTSVIVAMLGILFLQEWPRLRQWGGIALAVAGALVYFYPAMPAGQVTGLLVVGAGVLANAVSSILGRHINRHSGLPPVAVTGTSMGVGAAVLLAAGLLAQVPQGMPPLGWADWAIVAWLAVVNTAFAFTLWNHTLRTLPAVESSILNSTMLIQIALLAWAFLGEPIALQQGIGLALAALGVILVQL